MDKNIYNRYSRQIHFTELGEEGQSKLLSSSAVVIGCGALGTSIANSLVRAGVGNIKIIDRDVVKISDLHRQILFDENDVKNNLPKAIAAKNKLNSINSNVNVSAIVDDATSLNIESFISGAGVVLDGTDNMETRFLINDACIKNNIPWIYGGAVGSIGTVMPIYPDYGPCLRCYIPELPSPSSFPTCDMMGVLSSTTQIVASIQVVYAIKILTHYSSLVSRPLSLLTWFNIWDNDFRNLVVNKDNNCPCCVSKNFQYLSIKKISNVVSLCGTGLFQVLPSKEMNITLKDLTNKLSKLGNVESNEHLLKCKIEEYEIEIFPTGRALISGVKDEKEAKSIYAKYIGL